MKTTIIELLTKISKYENMPYKIEYKNEIYTYDEKAKDYKGYVGDYLFDEYVISDILNDDVYILEMTITMNKKEDILNDILVNQLELLKDDDTKSIKTILKNGEEIILYSPKYVKLLMNENIQFQTALEDIEELLLNEEQPIQPSNIRYDILEIIKKALLS